MQLSMKLGFLHSISGLSLIEVFPDVVVYVKSEKQEEKKVGSLNYQGNELP